MSGGPYREPGVPTPITSPSVLEDREGGGGGCGGSVIFIAGAEGCAADGIASTGGTAKLTGGMGGAGASAALYSSDSQCWLTPRPVLDRILVLEPRGIALDPCGNVDSLMAAREQWLIELGQDGLARPWPDLGLIFVNPPFEDAERWAAKCAAAAQLGSEIILLLPARTDTVAYQRYILPHCAALCFWRGRMKFGAGRAGSQQGQLFGGEPAPLNEGENTAPFATLISYFGSRPRKFSRAFEAAGNCVVTT